MLDDSGVRRRTTGHDENVDDSAKTDTLDFIKKLDVFTKVPEDCKNTGTASGVGIAVVTALIVVFLLCAEVSNYLDKRVIYSYAVDSDYNSTFVINVDLVVNTPCRYIGFDVLDVTGTETHGHGDIEEIPTKFDLDEDLRYTYDMVRHFHNEIRSQHHSLQSDFYSQAHPYSDLHPPITKLAEVMSKYDHHEQDACRFKGKYTLTKVAGNMHVTLGKPVNFGGQHAHFQMHGSGADTYNFSHRIYHLSFGPELPGRINALDAEEKITQDRIYMYQYFLQAVPIVLDKGWSGLTDSYQYAVQEQERVISHAKGSHGIPGIFFKFEVSPLKIKISDASQSLSTFLTNLAAIVGGVCASSALLCYLINGLVSMVTFQSDLTSLR